MAATQRNQKKNWWKLILSCRQRAIRKTKKNRHLMNLFLFFFVVVVRLILWLGKQIWTFRYATGFRWTCRTLWLNWKMECRILNWIRCEKKCKFVVDWQIVGIVKRFLFWFYHRKWKSQWIYFQWAYLRCSVSHSNSHSHSPNQFYRFFSFVGSFVRYLFSSNSHSHSHSYSILPTANGFLLQQHIYFGYKMK